MLLLSDLVPSRLGLAWRQPRGKCLTVLKAPVVRQDQNYAILQVVLGSEQYDLALLFDRDVLWRLEVDLHESRSFWEDYVPADVERAYAESLALFERYVQYNSMHLGPPDYLGRRGSEGYPEDQTAEQIAYWTQTHVRMQLEQDHPDKEFPFYLRAVTYQPAGT